MAVSTAGSRLYTRYRKHLKFIAGSKLHLVCCVPFSSLTNSVLGEKMDHNPDQPWALSTADREGTIERIAKSISSIAFFKGLDINDADARAAAAAAEKKAYTAAQVAARTTTGHRPHAETTSSYARSAFASFCPFNSQINCYCFVTCTCVVPETAAAGSWVSWCWWLSRRVPSLRQMQKQPTPHLM